MRCIHSFSSAMLAVSLLCGACDRIPKPEISKPDNSEPLLERSPGVAAHPTSPTGEEQVTGNLRNVNQDAKTIVVTVDGVDHTFMYDDRTEVQGAAGQIQGLVGLNGPITVYYQREGDSDRAVRIDLQ